MVAKHKFQNSHIVIESALPADQLLKISEEVAAALTTTKGRMNGGRLLQFGWNLAGRGTDSRTYKLGNEKRYHLSYVVKAAAHGDRTRLTTGIVYFKTKQDALFGIIPTGPKKLVSYPAYSDYMVALGKGVEQVDPSCSIQLIERPGR